MPPVGSVLAFVDRMLIIILCIAASQRDSVFDVVDVDSADGVCQTSLVTRRRVNVDGRRAGHRRGSSRLQRRRQDRLERDGGGRGLQRTAAGAQPRRAVGRLDHGTAELRVDGQVKDKVEREVGRLQSVRDDDRRLHKLTLALFDRVEVEIDEFRRRDKKQKHGDDADQCECETSFCAFC